MGYCKCEGQGCPMKQKCYRFTSKTNEYRQSWFAKTPIKDDGDCEHFLPV